MFHPPSPPTDRVSAFFTRIDAQLAATPDIGMRGVFLNGQISRWERLNELLLRWASGELSGPNPVGNGATVWDVTQTLGGLYQRLTDVQQDARNQIKEAAL